MAGLPHFPVQGIILSNNVSIDRFTLVPNNVGNSVFLSGQYIFYSKNSSLWYKYKNTTQSWTQELLYIEGASQSNTKFDQNGYPITAYLDINGLVKVNYYTDGILNTKTIAISGILPTVIQTVTDTYVFWVPENYNGFLYWVQLYSDFNVVYPVVVDMPLGQISSLQIENALNNTMIFSFTIDNSSKKVYVGFTSASHQMGIYDLSASVNFI